MFISLLFYVCYFDSWNILIDVLHKIICIILTPLAADIENRTIEKCGLIEALVVFDGTIFGADNSIPL